MNFRADLLRDGQVRLRGVAGTLRSLNLPGNLLDLVGDFGSPAVAPAGPYEFAFDDGTRAAGTVLRCRPGGLGLHVVSFRLDEIPH
jgi:hypothetical protein